MKSLICVLIFSFCMYGQIKNFQPDRKNLKSYHLRGKVIQITTSSYEPKLSNDGKSYIAGTWLNSETIIFNKNGYVDHLANSQWDYMNQSAKPYEFEGSTERFKFNYDSLNNLISVAENGKPLKEYLIDDNNNFIGFKIKFKTTKYFFDEYLLKHKGSNDYYFVNEKGQLLELKENNCLTKYIYDYATGNLIEKKEWDEKGNLIKVTTYTYNENDDVFEENAKDYVLLTIRGNIENTYQYDRNGNWTEKIVKLNGSFNEIVYRTIRYEDDKPVAASKTKVKNQNKSELPPAAKPVKIKHDLPINLKDNYSSVEKKLGKPFMYYPEQIKDNLRHVYIFLNWLYVGFNDQDEVVSIKSIYNFDGYNFNYYRDNFFGQQIGEEFKKVNQFIKPFRSKPIDLIDELYYNVNGNILKIRIAGTSYTTENYHTINKNEVLSMEYVLL